MMAWTEALSHKSMCRGRVTSFPPCTPALGGLQPHYRGVRLVKHCKPAVLLILSKVCRGSVTSYVYAWSMFNVYVAQ